MEGAAFSGLQRQLRHPEPEPRFSHCPNPDPDGELIGIAHGIEIADGMGLSDGAAAAVGSTKPQPSFCSSP